MEKTLPNLYLGAEQISRLAILVALLSLFALHLMRVVLPVETEIAIAFISLCIGIPHGAVDHLIAIPSKPRSRFALSIALYIAIALFAGWAIAHWNLIGFQIVLLVSALHFGFGDAAYRNEWQGFAHAKKNSRLITCAYALPAGLLPVVLPLTDHRTLAAIQRINPKLIPWAGGRVQEFRFATLVLALSALLLLLISRHFSLALDLTLLAMLSFFAPPLIAFAFYFGLWHALRHTVRLIPKYPRAMEKFMDRDESIWAAISTVIKPGLFALAGTLAFSILLIALSPTYFSRGIFWTTLLIVWALTFPHMAATARFDLPAIQN